jgi:hypothetical protein
MNNHFTIGIVFVASLMTVAVAESTVADGCFVPLIKELGATTQLVSSPKQEAILATDGELGL